MSFRQFGGLKYASKHNVVSSNLNSSNQLFVIQNVGQPNSTIDFLSDISGNITIYGNLDISGNTYVSGNLDVSGNVDISNNLTAYYMFLSSGSNYNTENNAVMPKSYIDLVASGINVVGKVYAVSTLNISLTQPQPFILDSILVPSGSNVLLTAQNDASYNGVYLYNGTNLIRSTTILPTGFDAVGALVIVLYGNTYAQSGWLQTYKNPSTALATVGTDPLDFTEFYSFNFKLGNGLISTPINDTNYISVDPNLNYIYTIDGSDNVLGLGTQTTTTALNLGSSTCNVGINNSNPVYALDVSGNLNFTGNITQDGGPLPGTTQWSNGSNSAIYYNLGNVGIGTSTPSDTLHVNGTTISASFNATSDYRIKENVMELDEKYSVDNLRPVKYTNKITEKEDLGLIAHELGEIYPYLVNGEKDGENFQSINYNGIIAILINEIKELKNILRKNNLY